MKLIKLMKYIEVIAAVLLVIGGGLYGVVQVDLVDQLVVTTALSALIYILVGASALYQVLGLRGIWRRWSIDVHSAQLA